MTYSHNTTAFALSLTFDLASIRFKVRPFKLLRTPSPHDHLPRLPILRILSGSTKFHRQLLSPLSKTPASRTLSDIDEILIDTGLFQKFLMVSLLCNLAVVYN